jgi:hypothetical protein
MFHRDASLRRRGIRERSTAASPELRCLAATLGLDRRRSLGRACVGNVRSGHSGAPCRLKTGLACSPSCPNSVCRAICEPVAALGNAIFARDGGVDLATTAAVITNPHGVRDSSWPEPSGETEIYGQDPPARLKISVSPKYFCMSGIKESRGWLSKSARGARLAESGQLNRRRCSACPVAKHWSKAEVSCVGTLHPPQHPKQS